MRNRKRIGALLMLGILSGMTFQGCGTPIKMKVRWKLN